MSQRGVEITQEHQQSFLKLKEAYDVLSDPKRKKLYDEYGLKGLKLVENPTELNHVELLKNYQVIYFTLITLVSLLIILSFNLAKSWRQNYFIFSYCIYFCSDFCRTNLV